MRLLALFLAVLALGACAAPVSLGPPPPVASVERTAAPELLADVFSIIDAQYPVVPRFAAVRHGALQELAKALPEARLRVDAEGDASLLTYPGSSGTLETARLAGSSRDEALRDAATAQGIARRIAPALPPATVEYALLRGALRSLDPHSSFLDPEGYRELQAATSGSFAGLGIEITIRDDQLTVVAPIEGTPAWWAGIQPGDRIVGIDGLSTRGLSLPEAVKRMRGPKGSKVTITIQREGMREPKDISIVREIIQVQSVTTQAIEPALGYVRIRQFQERTARDLEEGLQRLERTGRLAGLVLDLRNNPGGLLSSAVEVSEKFLGDGTLVTYTESRVRAQSLRFVARSGSPRLRVPIAVLVNEGSASASEIVAAALQDHGRAILVGQPTFRKGSVQSIIPLRDGSALRLTTAHYFTPKGRAIDGRGLTPDVVVEPAKEDAAQRPESLSEAERQARDLQLQRGLDRVRASGGLRPPQRAVATPPARSPAPAAAAAAPPAPSPGALGLRVTYRVKGTAGSVALTYRNAQGGTEQSSVRLPWEVSFDAKGGSFLYVSAQNQGASGSVTCEIQLGDETRTTSTSSGAYVVAECSNVAERN